MFQMFESIELGSNSFVTKFIFLIAKYKSVINKTGITNSTRIFSTSLNFCLVFLPALSILLRLPSLYSSQLLGLCSHRTRCFVISWVFIRVFSFDSLLLNSCKCLIIGSCFVVLIIKDTTECKRGKEIGFCINTYFVCFSFFYNFCCIWLNNFISIAW